MEQNELQQRIERLEAWKRSMESYSSIPFDVDKALNNRGFVKTGYFIAGKGTIAANGQYELLIPDADKSSTLLVTSHTSNATEVSAELTQAYESNYYGDSTSRFDITNPAGTTFRYTWDGVGTNPNINSTTLPIGSQVRIFSINMNSANTTAASRPAFYVTGSGSNYFEIDNTTPGVVESDKTIGTGGAIIGGKLTNNYGIYALGTAGDAFDFIVFLTKNLFTDL